MGLSDRIKGWLKRAAVFVDRRRPVGPMVWAKHADGQIKAVDEAEVPPEATVLGPLVWVRQEGDVMTPCRAEEARAFRFFIGGQLHEHTDTAEDGTWIYEARKY